MTALTKVTTADQLYGAIDAILKASPVLWWASETDSHPKAVKLSVFDCLFWQAEGKTAGQDQLKAQLDMSQPGDGWLILYSILSTKKLISFKRSEGKGLFRYVLTRVGWSFVGIKAKVVET